MARPRTAPFCAACGRPLRKPRHLAVVRTDDVARPVQTVPWAGMTADGDAPTRGDYGDNMFCTMKCGWLFACRMVRAIGSRADAVALLPEGWRAARGAPPAAFSSRSGQKPEPEPDAEDPESEAIRRRWLEPEDD